MYRTIAVAVLCFPILLGGGSVTVLGQEQPAETTELQQLESSGAPTGLSDLKSERGDDQTDAGQILEPLRLTWEKIDMAVIDDFLFDSPEVPPSFLKKWESVAAERKRVFETVDQAVDADVWTPRVNYTADSAQAFIQQLQDRSVTLRSLARVLMYQSRYQMHSGDADGAARTTLKLLKLSRMYPRFGMVGGVTCNAVEQIGLSALGQVLEQSDDLGVETHSAIETELALHDSLDKFTEALITERVIGMQMLRDQGVVGLVRVEPYLKAMRLAIDESNKTMAEQQALLDPQEHGVTGAMIDPAVNMLRGSSHRGTGHDALFESGQLSARQIG